MLRLWVAKSVWFLKTEDGPTSVEYAVMIALIISVCYVAISNIGSPTKNGFANPALQSSPTSLQDFCGAICSLA